MSIFFSLSGYFVCLSIMFCCLFVCECSVCLWMLFLSCLLWMLFQSCRLWVFFKYFRMWMLFLFVCLWMLFCLSFCEFSSYLSVCTFVSLCVNVLSGGECFLFSFCLLVYNCTSCWFVCEFPLFICLWMFFLSSRLWMFCLSVRQWMFCLPVTSVKVLVACLLVLILFICDCLHVCTSVGSSVRLWLVCQFWPDVRPGVSCRSGLMLCPSVHLWLLWPPVHRLCKMADHLAWRPLLCQLLVCE